MKDFAQNYFQFRTEMITKITSKPQSVTIANLEIQKKSEIKYSLCPKNPNCTRAHGIRKENTIAGNNDL